MNLTLTVDILKVMKVVQKHPCQKRREPYKIASCFLSSLTTLIESQFIRRGYKKMAVESSLEKATFLYKRGGDKPGDDWLRITQLLVKEPLVASLHINVKREELVYVEAVLKIIGVHQKCISLPA